MEPFTFASSSDLRMPVCVKINTLDGQQKPIPFSTLLKRPDLRFKGSNLSSHFEFFVTARLWADSKPLTVPMQTAYKPFKNSSNWNEWLKLPISYSDAPLNAQLAVTVWDLSPFGGDNARYNAVPFGGTTIPLFDKDSSLMKGRQRCYLHRNKEADGRTETTTPHILPRKRRRKDGKVVEEQRDARVAEIERLEGLIKKHEMGEIPENPWLDRLVFRQIEKLERGASRARLEQPRIDSAAEDADEESQAEDAGSAEDEGVFYLYIDFPRFDHPIVFTDAEYPAPPISTMLGGSNSDLRLKPPPEVSLGPGINDNGEPDDPSIGRLIRIYDPEVGIKENPAETKHRRLIRNQKTGVLDREMKPNAFIRDNLNMVIAYGPLHDLKQDEKDMVWKFRHYLTRDKKALTKFVKSVTWSDPQEARAAVQMLPRWTEIDVDDALELLGPTFGYPAVRSYAVDRLRKSTDDELLLYLLQLVQALKFEKPLIAEANGDSEQDSSLARFLITRAANNFTLGNYLHWYLMVECDDRTPQQDTDSRQLFAKVEYDFMLELLKVPGGPQYRKTLLRQGELVTLLSKAARDIRASREDRPRKIEYLKKFMADPKNETIVIDPPLPLPLDPSVMISGCYPDESNVFKSSLLPLLVTWKTVSGQKYPMMFKVGDDLRQDQLVVQIITLMDRLLRNENLDLKLSPYKILATGPFAGAAQFVPSSTLSSIIQSRYKTIHAYLRHHNPDNTAPLGVRKETMETYIKSCAGYCVITYLLGVGDRHLDNLLLAPSGHFFHADFGYILGRDPKPFAPLMKLAREMVEGMGGAQHPYYASFKQYCFTAFASLRKSSNLILNLFALMSEANIPDIKMEPDKAVLKVQERFHLELTEEEAIRGFEQLIADSVSAVMPVVIDRLHGFVQGWRA